MKERVLSILLFSFCLLFLFLGTYLSTYSFLNFSGQLLLVNLLSSFMCFAIAGALYLLRIKLNS